jgi:L-asparaginase
VDSIRVACENIGGIYVVFNGNMINGCRAVKIRTRSRNAFESVNYPYAATIDKTEIQYNPLYFFPQKQEEVKFFTAVATDVMLIKLAPGVKPDIFDFIKGKYRGVVVESFGSGGVPFVGDGNILAKMEELIQAGMIVVITTQCLFEGGNLNLYEVGQKIMKSRVIPAYDMTTEASLTKLMWALGQTSDFEEVKKLFLAPINNDLTRYY